MSFFKSSFLYRWVIKLILITFSFSSVLPSKAMAQVMSLPVPGSMVTPSETFEPVLMKGLLVHPENPLLFDFIIDQGDENLSPTRGHSAPEGGSVSPSTLPSALALDTKATQGTNRVPSEVEIQRLIKYFLTALTIKEDNLWVNLSPYEKDRMINDDLKATEMGQEMLAQDYLLKQLTASMIYPEKDLGKAFWDRVYAKAQEVYGTTDIPVDTFNKVWIVADRARVVEHKNTGFVTSAHLKVMLDTDYEAASHQKDAAESSASAGDVAMQHDAVGALHATPLQPDSSHELTKNIIREIILPEIEKEVNEGKNFASLRQMFYAMILATWYKQALKDTLLNQVYTDKAKTGGVLSDDLTAGEKIYAQYLDAYKKGVFNYIKDDNQSPTRGHSATEGGSVSPSTSPAELALDMKASQGAGLPYQGEARRYFSGGLQMNIPSVLDRAQSATTVDMAAISSRKFKRASVGIKTVSSIGLSKRENENLISELKARNLMVETLMVETIQVNDAPATKGFFAALNADGVYEGGLVQNRAGSEMIRFLFSVEGMSKPDVRQLLKDLVSLAVAQSEDVEEKEQADMIFGMIENRQSENIHIHRILSTEVSPYPIYSRKFEAVRSKGVYKVYLTANTSLNTTVTGLFWEGLPVYNTTIINEIFDAMKGSDGVLREWRNLSLGTKGARKAFGELVKSLISKIVNKYNRYIYEVLPTGTRYYFGAAYTENPEALSDLVSMDQDPITRGLMDIIYDQWNPAGYSEKPVLLLPVPNNDVVAFLFAVYIKDQYWGGVLAKDGRALKFVPLFAKESNEADDELSTWNTPETLTLLKTLSDANLNATDMVDVFAKQSQGLSFKQFLNSIPEDAETFDLNQIIASPKSLTASRLEYFYAYPHDDGFIEFGLALRTGDKNDDVEYLSFTGNRYKFLKSTVRKIVNELDKVRSEVEDVLENDFKPDQIGIFDKAITARIAPIILRMAEEDIEKSRKVFVESFRSERLLRAVVKEALANDRRLAVVRINADTPTYVIVVKDFNATGFENVKPLVFVRGLSVSRDDLNKFVQEFERNQNTAYLKRAVTFNNEQLSALKDKLQKAIQDKILPAADMAQALKKVDFSQLGKKLKRAKAKTDKSITRSIPLQGNQSSRLVNLSGGISSLIHILAKVLTSRGLDPNRLLISAEQPLDKSPIKIFFAAPTNPLIDQPTHKTAVLDRVYQIGFLKHGELSVDSDVFVATIRHMSENKVKQVLAKLESIALTQNDRLFDEKDFIQNIMLPAINDVVGEKLVFPYISSRITLYPAGIRQFQTVLTSTGYLVTMDVNLSKEATQQIIVWSDIPKIDPRIMQTMIDKFQERQANAMFYKLWMKYQQTQSSKDREAYFRFFEKIYFDTLDEYSRFVYQDFGGIRYYSGLHELYNAIEPGYIFRDLDVMPEGFGNTSDEKTRGLLEYLHKHLPSQGFDMNSLLVLPVSGQDKLAYVFAIRIKEKYVLGIADKNNEAAVFLSLGSGDKDQVIEYLRDLNDPALLRMISDAIVWRESPTVMVEDLKKVLGKHIFAKYLEKIPMDEGNGVLHPETLLKSKASPEKNHVAFFYAEPTSKGFELGIAVRKNQVEFEYITIHDQYMKIDPLSAQRMIDELFGSLSFHIETLLNKSSDFDTLENEIPPMVRDVIGKVKASIIEEGKKIKVLDYPQFDMPESASDFGYILPTRLAVVRLQNHLVPTFVIAAKEFNNGLEKALPLVTVEGTNVRRSDLERLMQTIEKTTLKNTLPVLIRNKGPQEVLLRVKSDITDMLKANIQPNGEKFISLKKKISEKALSVTGTDNAALNGGIDLNSKNMGLDIMPQQGGLEMKIDPALIAEFKQGDFSGIEGVILKIEPIADPLTLLRG